MRPGGMTFDGDIIIDWDAPCRLCRRPRWDHFRESVNGGSKPVPTSDGECHGTLFRITPSEQRAREVNEYAVRVT